MDRIAITAQAQIRGDCNEASRDLAAAGRSQGGPRQLAELPESHQRHSLRENQRPGVQVFSVITQTPLRCRLVKTVQTALKVADHTIAPNRRAPQPILPSVHHSRPGTLESVAARAGGLTARVRNISLVGGGIVACGLHRGLVNRGHNVARLSTSAADANGRREIITKEIPTIEAERVGMSSQRLQRVAQLNQGYVDAGKVAGIATAVLRDGKLVHQSVAGTRSTDDPAPLPMDAIYRVYSMTKPITATAAMQLYEQGKFQLTDPVARFIPEFKQMTVLKDGEAVPVKQKMTMHHLLTHTAGLSYGADPRDPVDKMYLDAGLWASKDLAEFAEKLAEIPLKHEPGTQWHYSVASDITGLVVQRLSGQPFDKYLTQHIFEPLDMVDTSFAVPEEKAGRFLPNHVRDMDTGKPRLIGEGGSLEVRGQSAMEYSAAKHDFHNSTLFMGGHGLVSTLRDYARFAEATRAGGVFNGARILGPKTVNFMAMNHLPGVLRGGFAGAPLTGAGPPIHGAGSGLGYAVIVDPSANGAIGTAGQMYWDGLAGTAFLIDPVENITVVSMMQLLNCWYSYPKELRVATYQAILDSRAHN